jgi:hypothetical protein
MVEFDGLVVGCLEEEILLLQELDHLLSQARKSAESASPSVA